MFILVHYHNLKGTYVSKLTFKKSKAYIYVANKT